MIVGRLTLPGANALQGGKNGIVVTVSQTADDRPQLASQAKRMKRRMTGKRDANMTATDKGGMSAVLRDGRIEDQNARDDTGTAPRVPPPTCQPSPNVRPARVEIGYVVRMDRNLRGGGNDQIRTQIARIGQSRKAALR